MQFLLTVVETFLADGTREARAGSATPDEAAAVDAFNALLVRRGHWIFAGGLSSPDQAVVLDNREGGGLTVPGPLHGGPEAPGGFWVIQADDGETARELAVAGSRACNRKVELRPLL
jgi:hypothetical protein